MKVSLNWIREFTDIDLSVDALVEKIGAQLGAVEEVVDLGKRYQGIVVAKVVSCQKHSNADKLSVCKIDDSGVTPSVERDENGQIGVVCGAPNVRAGLLVAWLPPGVTVPATYDKDPLILEAREIRGIVSNGMLASPKELGISDDHDGIMELPSDIKVGSDFAKEFGLDDYIFDIENKMFTHRPDCFGILGVAREIAGITGRQFNSPEWYSEGLVSQEPRANLELVIENSAPELVSRFMAQVVEGVKVTSSPIWLQAYLSRVGIRPINNVVDVTNYSMYLTAQPLHAYDYDKLCKVAGTETARLEARLSKKGDKLSLLNGKELLFEDNDTILITSKDIPVGIGGVMGGADTEVDENTKNIVLECANFDMYALRRASMRHGLFTDAVTRFTKGQSPLQIPAVISKSVDLLTTLSGGAAGTIIDDYTSLARSSAVIVDVQFINGRLGLDLSSVKIAEILQNVEFRVDVQGTSLCVDAPFWRTDISTPEDIVEEVGRLYGYDHLPLQLPSRTIVPVSTNTLHDFKHRLRTILAGAGANEVLSYSFVHAKVLQNAGQGVEDSYKLSNALSPDLQYYRQSLQPSLLDKVHTNIKSGHDRFVVFEIGKTHNKVHGLGEDGLPGEIEMFALCFASKEQLSGAAYYQARAYLDFIGVKLGLQLQYESIDNDPGFPVTRPYDRSRSALVSVKNGLLLGQLGEYRPEVARAFKLPAYSAGFEISTTALLEAVLSTTSNYQSPGKYPGLTQDITLQLPSGVKVSSLEQAAQATLEELKPEHSHTNLKLIDIYQDGSDNAFKNITFRLQIASSTHTLEDAAVNDLLEEVAKKLAESHSSRRI